MDNVCLFKLFIIAVYINNYVISKNIPYEFINNFYFFTFKKKKKKLFIFVNLKK